MSLPRGTSSPSDHVLCDENLARLDSFLPNSQRGQDQAEAQEPWTQAQGGAQAQVIQVWGWHLGGRRLQLVPWAPVGLTLAPYPTPPPPGATPSEPFCGVCDANSGGRLGDGPRGSR